MCIQCKEKHIYNEDTAYHNIIVYREKKATIPKQEFCIRHENMVYKWYCNHCEVPACIRCTDHRKYNKVDIRTAYITKREKYRELVHIMRRETIIVCRFLLANAMTCRSKITNRTSSLKGTAKKLKNLLGIAVIDISHKYKCLLIKMLLKTQKRFIAETQSYEQKYEQSNCRPITFLLTHTKQNRNSPTIAQDIRLSPDKLFSKPKTTELIVESQITDKKTRYEPYVRKWKLMAVPKLVNSLEVVGIQGWSHISSLTLDNVIVNDKDRLFLINSACEILHHVDGLCYNPGQGKGYVTSFGLHSVNKRNELFYIDGKYNIKKMSNDVHKKTTTFILSTDKKQTPRSLYCSLFNDDLLVGVIIDQEHAWTANVRRYDKDGRVRHVIPSDNSNQLYLSPNFITENNNRDIVVSDTYFGIVVTDWRGNHRFSFTGHPQGNRQMPLQIATDVLSNILVCYNLDKKIAVLNKDGRFLLYLKIKQDIQTAWSLSYDVNTHLIWVGAKDIKTVSVWKYLNQEDDA